MTQDESGLRPRRSLLYVPASNARALEKAVELESDGVILDLEAVAAAQPDAVLAPKVSSAAEVRAYDRALSGRTSLWIMVETARAVLNLREIVETAASTRLEALVLGPNDLSSELGLKGPMGRAGLRSTLLQMNIAARAHGVAALGGVFNSIDDAAGFEAECAEEAGLGLDGKTLIHPSQIEPANRAFSPSAEEIDWARAVIAAFAAPQAEGQGAIRLGGQMIERLHLARAQRMLAMAGA